eukprot:scaffold58714_cov42-Prasinocladus_malaysianus.AAC.1
MALTASINIAFIQQLLLYIIQQNAVKENSFLVNVLPDDMESHPNCSMAVINPSAELTTATEQMVAHNSYVTISM